MKKAHSLSSAIIVVALCTLTPQFAMGQANNRPVQDFVDAQGTSIIVVPPVADFIGWFDPDSLLLASVDYAGLADQWITDESGGAVSFGTTFVGTVTERPLKDGRTRVGVRLITFDALTWVFDLNDFTGDFTTVPLQFGARAPEVLAGATPALGMSLLDATFIHGEPVGGDLPDLIQLAFSPTSDQELLTLSFHATADGELSDGTPGRATVQQKGLFNTSGQGGALDDGFPVEIVDLQAVGN